MAPADRPGLVVVRGAAAISSTRRSSAATTRSSSCYRLTTGEPVWRHRDAARFWESNGGAGPRGTPTLSNGRVYAFGATGIVNALDARTGARGLVAQRRDRHGRQDIPDWGFAELAARRRRPRRSSPRRAGWPPTTSPTGEPRWVGPTGGARLQLAASGDDRRRDADPAAERQPAATSVAPADGTLLWEHDVGRRRRIVQPALTADGDVLISAPATRRAASACAALAVAHGAGGWTVEERWTSRGLKPYFNDFVVHEGPRLRLRRQHPRRASISRTATRKWKGGRYGNGQLLLLRRSGSAAGAVRRRRARAGPGDARPVHRARAGSRRSTARPGTTRCWSATCCWFATARRWPRSGCRCGGAVHRAASEMGGGPTAVV